MQAESHPRADPTRDGTIFAVDLVGVTEPPPLLAAHFARIPERDGPPLEAAMHASGDYPPDVAIERFSPDRQAYGIWADGMIVTYGWVAYSPEPIGDSGVSFRLHLDDAYIYDCATRPEYQGRGYYKALLRGMQWELRRDGCRRAWIATEPGNVISQKGIFGAGFTKVADVNLTLRLHGQTQPELYGVPGVPEELLASAAWAFVPNAL